jgi:hypothetical protein
MSLRLVCVFLASLFAASSSAQTSLPSVVLTPERVEAIVTSFVPLRDRLRELGAEFETAGDAGKYSAQLQALAMMGAASSVFDDAAREYGFADFQDWVATTNSVILAHAFAQNPEMDADVQQALDQIDSQQGMSAEQKEQMKAMILQSMGAIETMRPPEENIAAVAPYAAEIEAMLNSD